jgi:hypothetical protein
MQDLLHFLALVFWNFWTVAAGVMLAFEPVMRWFFEKYDVHRSPLYLQNGGATRPPLSAHSSLPIIWRSTI